MSASLQARNGSDQDNMKETRTREFHCGLSQGRESCGGSVDITHV